MIRPRPHLESLYRTPDDPESHHPYLRLDKNERVVPFPPQIWNRFLELLTPDSIMAYPELEDLYQRLASYIGVDRKCLYFATGSDLGIKTVYETYINPADRVQIHTPSYAMHEVYCKMFQANLIRIPYDSRLRLDENAYLDAITPETRMVLLENPNGFISTAQPMEFIRNVVEKAQRCNALALLDEAYYLFSNQTIQSLFQEYDNVIITRTFSKDLGIAGLRCAYLLSQPQNIDSIYRVKPMHEINSAAVAFSQAMLEYPQHVRQFVREVQEGIDFVKDALTEIGLLTAGGSGNFFVVYLGEHIDIPTVVREMKSRGILIRRPFTVENLRGWLRVGAGNVDQMQKFVTAFSEALRASGWSRENYSHPELR